MHTYGDEGIDWEGIDASASEIARFIARWGRIHVAQYKEKFGTVRVYCTMGVDSLHGLIFPFHNWIHNGWPYQWDIDLTDKIRKYVNWALVPWQKFIYRLAYKRAIKRRPHLINEILCCADYHEALEGLGVK